MKKPKLFIAALVATLTLSGCDLVGLPSIKDLVDQITGNNPGTDPGQGNTGDNTDNDTDDDDPRTYTVTFNTDKGTVEGGTIKTVDNGSNITLPNATATGYELLGWALESGATSKDYSVGATFTVNSDLTLYAVWKEQQSVVNVTGVSLDKHTLTLNVNETEVLTATVQPENATNKAVTWTSSSTSVATVSNGTVTAKAAGSTTIKVKTKDGNKEDSCVVTVTSPGPVDNTITPAQAIKYADQAGSGNPTGTEYLIKGTAEDVSINSRGNLCGSFKDSNLNFVDVLLNDVASRVTEIEGREIVIKGYPELYQGEYKVGYLPANASPTNDKYNPTLISVSGSGTIIEEDVHVTNIAVSPISKTLKVGQTTILTATIKPDNATNKNVTWLSSNSTVASVSNGLVTAKAVGTAEITVKSVDGKLEAKSTITVENGGTIDPVEGDNYTISFKQNSGDSGTALDVDTFNDEISSGSNYVSASSVDRIFPGEKGIKFGSSNYGGELVLDTSNSIKSTNCLQVLVEVVQYKAEASSVKLFDDATLLADGSSTDGTITATLSTPKPISSLRITTSKRAYVSKITFVCKSSTPVEATSISIPSAIDVSVGNSTNINLAYSPAGANTNKEVTWSSSNPNVANVTNGLVSGLSEGTSTIKATLTHNGYEATCLVTVSRISVTSVTISETSKTLNVNGTYQLSASVLPSNATNKNVTWSSTNQTVATVDNTGKITAKAAGSSIIKVTTQDGNYSAQCSLTVTAVQRDAWTIMIYMCGNDLESANGLATGDIEEILSVRNQPDDVNIIIETGGATKWKSTYSISNKNLTRYHVASKKLVKDSTLSQANMGLTSTFQSFLEWGLTDYPAEKTGVILWNHGGGMRGVCYDENYNDDDLTNDEVLDAVKKAFTSTNRTEKLEFIGYDACLMAVQDVAEFNSPYFNYMISSEESEAGYGWDYDTWVDDLYNKKDTKTILKAIVDGFIADNGGANGYGEYYQGEYYPCDQTLSYLDLSKMTAYKTAWEDLAAQLKTKITSGNKSNFNKLIGKTKYFAGSDYTRFCTFDCQHFLELLGSDSTFNPGGNYISNAKAALSDLVAYSVAQKEAAHDAHGLAFYYVAGSGDNQSTYSAAKYSNFTDWSYLSRTYGGRISTTYEY